MFSGARYETIFLKDSKASTKEDFKVSMKYLEVLNPSAHKYLMDKVPKTCSKAFLQLVRCCDVVENEIS